MALRRLGIQDYTVGWVCALPLELAAATAMLDEEHQSLPQDNDPYLYTLGCIGEHNVVLACLPSGQVGTNSAAVVATRMQLKFPSLRIGLMVGIGGGVPSTGADIRLGDVVISQPHATHGGVVQYDFGKTGPGGRLNPTGFLNTPPTVFLNAISKLRSNQYLDQDTLSIHLSAFKRLAQFSRDEAGPDVLYKATYNHIGGPTCDGCEKDKTVERTPRSSQEIVIHYGTIASGNQVMKDGITRDKLSAELGGVLCFEMEAAGLMNSFSCLVIRGICDYADKHKNKRCQPYAAAAAAASAKAVLLLVPAVETLKLNHEDETIRHKEYNATLALLPSVPQAAFSHCDKQHDPTCLPNTRVDVIKQIMAWADDKCDERCIFWLNGMAGMGKSTIARTIANEYNKAGRLGASFFFTRGAGDLASSSKLFTSLARQLAEKELELRRYVCEAVLNNTGISQLGLEHQWRQLILKPLSRVKQLSVTSPLVIVIDALDECDNDDDIQLVLQLLATAKSLQNVQLRIFVTSRPETSIRHEISEIPEDSHQDYILHNIAQSIVDHDLSIFFKYNLELVQRQCHLAVGWPSEENIKLLVQRAGGLFIYAATAYRFIAEDGRLASSRLTRLLQHDNTGLPPEKKLDEIYITVLTQSVRAEHSEQETEDLRKKFRYIVGSIILLFDILPAPNLAELLQIPKEEIDQTLMHLHSVLDIPERQDGRIRLLHPSFRDFLLDEQRCVHPQFRIDRRLVHQYMFTNCLRVMSNHLRRDMCDLRSPGALAAEIDRHKVDRHIPLHIQYACRFWVYHLQQSNVEACDWRSIQTFLQHHFLYWLEALAIIRCISNGVIMVKVLDSILRPQVKAASPSKLLYRITSIVLSKLKSQENLLLLGDHKVEASSALLLFIHDAQRFILDSASIIGAAPLQAYCSALLFSPKASIVRRLFWDQVPVWIKRCPDVQEEWSATLQTLEGHSGSVLSVAFSPDGQLVASASNDQTVRLWDAKTGAARHTLEGHSRCVSSIAFSPDGQLVASASYDQTVRLWDTKTGAARRTLKGHSDWVLGVAFSPDGQLVASASDDKTVRLWDAKTGAAWHTFEGHLSSVLSVAFSPDGKLVASASDDKTMRLWDAKTGAARHTLEGHLDSVLSVAFSPDGKLVASASYDQTVRLWDAKTGAARHTLEGHSRCVSSIAFSPDGQLVASASYDQTVRLWDTKTGAARRTLKGHSDSVRGVAFSPDSQLVASASDDKTVRLWDAKIRAAQCTPKGHSGSVSSIAFSSDGQLVVSTSNDKTVRLWDAKTGAARHTLEGHLDSVSSVAFSPDGQLVASASYDKTVRLWDTKTGAAWHTLEGHSGWVSSVAFSPDGQLVVSASDDKTVRLWDTKTGVVWYTLEGHSGSVWSVAFSPDSQLVVSASDDKTVRLWDAKTGAVWYTLEGHSGSVLSVAFSPDGQLVASASNDKTVRLWDVKTGAAWQKLELDTAVHTLSFFSCGQHLQTDWGVLNISCLFPSAASHPCGCLPSRFVGNNWVTEETENILWLPPDYRATCAAIWNGVVVLGHSSGRVSFLEFESGNKSL